MDGDLEQLGERIAEQAAHLDAAMHRLLADLREFDQRGGWHLQGALSCAHWLSWRVGWEPVRISGTRNADALGSGWKRPVRGDAQATIPGNHVM